jgi:hypothetical protein
VSAQVGIEDNRVINRAPIFNGAVVLTNAQLFTGAYTNAAGGNVSLISSVTSASIRLRSPLSCRLVCTTSMQATTARPNPPVIRAMNGGFAIAGGIQLKNLPTGPGDKLSWKRTYTDGAPKYDRRHHRQQLRCVQQRGYDPAFYQSFAVALFDGVYTTGGSIEKTKVWGFRGGLQLGPKLADQPVRQLHEHRLQRTLPHLRAGMLHSTSPAAAATRTSTSGRSVRARHGPRSRT